MAQGKYDLIIIGGGPAGAAAGVYAARKKLNTLLLTESFGGQSVASARIENWIGVRAIGGAELAIALEDHLRAQSGIEIREPARASAVKKTDDGFRVETDKGDIFQARAVLVATGGRHRRLNVPGEKEFDGRGVAYCSTCDAPIFQDKKVAVIGTGNAGLETALDLQSYAEAVYLMDIVKEPTGDKQTAEKVMALKKAVFLPQAKVIGLSGDNWVKGLRFEDLATKEIKELAVAGVFVAIGSVPNTELVRGLVELNERGEIAVSRPRYATSCPGIFAAGDATDEPYRQNNIAAGDAIKAVLSANDYIKRLPV
ncbi:MAG: FAD-dependent oxidoreductase [Planctomycetes bacterium]|jgi:alkyl hydroperoxide reductase subunit F|nr:FAD-dependent oxidoreductase [Planctomycetota bacterium]